MLKKNQRQLKYPTVVCLVKANEEFWKPSIEKRNGVTVSEDIGIFAFQLDLAHNLPHADTYKSKVLFRRPLFVFRFAMQS